MGLWGKDGFGEERDRFARERGFEREKDTGGGHGRGKQDLIGEEKEERVKEIEMRFWLCAVDIFNIKSGVLHPSALNLIFFLIIKIWVGMTLQTFLILKNKTVSHVNIFHSTLNSKYHFDTRLKG